MRPPIPGLALLLLLTACPTGGPLDDDDDTATPEPTPDPGPDCTDRHGLDAECAVPSCADLLVLAPDLDDGDYWVDGGNPTEPAFVVACDMTDDGGGWIRLALDDADGVLVVSRAEDNPWLKCADDAAFNFVHIGHEDDVVEDVVLEASALVAFDVGYAHPDSGEPYLPSQIEALRPVLGELHPGARMVAVAGDDDGGDWQDGGGSGLEVYVEGSGGDWFLLTPGRGGDCGGQPGDWPADGSVSAHYLWASDPDSSATMGDVGEDPFEMGGVPATHVLPVSVQAAVFTGGGVAWGYNADVFRVR